MDILISFYIAGIVVAELMGSKTFPLFSIKNFDLNASVAIFLMPALFTINDVITEVHGKERTRSIIRSGLLVIAFLIFFSIFATLLPTSSRFADTESSYDIIFRKSARISAASLTAFTTAEFLDVFIFVRIRKKFGKSKLWLRNNLSNFISQLVDTTVFMTLAFYGIKDGFNENLIFLIGLILPYWGLKCFMSIIETPFTYLGVKWLSKEQ